MDNDTARLLNTTSIPITGNVDNERVQITLHDNSLTARIKTLNIRITAIWHANDHQQYINFQIFVPQFLCNESFGNLGNCDGNTDNDESYLNDRE